LDAKSDAPNQELAGVNGNWWVGLSVMHTLFAREHNAIVDRLRIDYPAADGEWLFQKARVINAALIAKIHTVEWTPALLARRAFRHARQLLGLAWRGVCARLWPPRQRGDSLRYPGLDHRSSRRAICNDGGIHRGLPHAFAVARRILIPQPWRR